MTWTGGMTSPEEYPWLGAHWSFFKRRLDEGRLAHALMIEGPAGSGKTALASAMVARLLCAESQDYACGHCRSCELLSGGAHPDFFNLEPEEGSEVIKVDQIRGMIARLDLTTSISSTKVAYIRPAESMHPAAANALLKSLEEPAGDAVLILVSHDAGKLPVTIRSRCQGISVSQPEQKVVLDWLAKNSSQHPDELGAALQAAGGSPLRALRYLDSPELDAYAKVREALAVLLGRPASVSVVSSQLDGLEPEDLWRWISMCTGEIVKAQMARQPLNWLQKNVALCDKTLLQLQKQADINRQLSATPVRGDLLLQDWLIKLAEQAV